METIKFKYLVVSNDKKFILLIRRDPVTNSTFEELIKLDNIATVIPHAISTQGYTNPTEKYAGYDVFTVGGLAGHAIWISSKEFEELKLLLNF